MAEERQAGVFVLLSAMLRVMAPLQATIEQFAAEGFTHVECFCTRVTRLRPISWLPRISMKRGLVRAAISRASVTRALINNGNNGPTVAHFGEQIRFVKEKPRRG